MKPLSFFLGVLTLTMFAGASSALAVTYDLKENTPAVQTALNGRQSRYSELQDLKAQGAIGEDNRGYVKALSPQAQSVASAENADRRAIYQAIVDQNGLGQAGITQVQLAFAEVQREKAQSGSSIQLPSGDWVKK